MTLSPLRRGGRGRRRSAFTLLEVLVVVAILVVLAGVASIYVFKYLEDSKADKARLDTVTIQKAVTTFILKNDDVPQNINDVAQYLDGGAAMLLDPWGKQYQIEYVEVNGQQTPVVWTTDKDGNKITSADSKVRR
jgi:general secretion pathway protein G